MIKGGHVAQSNAPALARGRQRKGFSESGGELAISHFSLKAILQENDILQSFNVIQESGRSSGRESLESALAQWRIRREELAPYDLAFLFW